MKNNKLIIARESKKLTQQELAQKIEVSKNTIKAIEEGKYNPSINLCKKISKTLERKLEEIF